MADRNMALGTIPASEPSQAQASQAGALQTEVSAAEQSLLDTIKVISRNNDRRRCPAHPKIPLCACPAALASLTALDIAHAKRERFIGTFYIYLTAQQYSYDFTGSQSSHHNFRQRHGDTPKHFMRTYLQRDVCTYEFAPVGKQATIIDAMLKLWVLKNRQWKAMHGTHEATRKAVREYIDLVHDAADQWSIDAPDFDDFRIGDAVEIYDYKIGPPWHRTLIQVLPLSCNQLSEHMINRRGEGGQQKLYHLKARIVKIFPCHRDCEKMTEFMEHQWPDVAGDIVQRRYGLKLPLMVRPEKTNPMSWRPCIWNERGEKMLEDDEQLERCMDVADQIMVPDLDIADVARVYNKTPEMEQGVDTQLDAHVQSSELAGMEAELKSATQYMSSTIKVIALFDNEVRCPAHPKAAICSCPIALKKLGESGRDQAQRTRLLPMFASHVLDCPHAFDFDGTQSAHQAFKQREGDTAKHFMRSFLQLEVIKEQFAPVGKQAATIDALLGVWKAQNKVWRARYRSHEDTLRAYEEEALRECEENGTMSVPRALLPNCKNGDMFNIFSYKVGQPWHRTSLQILPLFCNQVPVVSVDGQAETRKQYNIGAKIVKIEPCHEECEKAEQNVRDAWAGCLADIAVDVFKLKPPLLVMLNEKERKFTRRPVVLDENGERVREGGERLLRALAVADQVFYEELEL